ncbi:MAG: VCBS repeat-containing protein [Bacteroidales bacterium]
MVRPLEDGNRTGCGNNLAAADFDMDGDMDYLAGNLGTNSLIRASMDHPVSLYVGDYDNNNFLDLIPTTYYTNEEDQWEEFPFFGLIDMERQVEPFRELYAEHKEFGRAGIDEVMARLPDATTLVLKGRWQPSVLVENLGEANSGSVPCRTRFSSVRSFPWSPVISRATEGPMPFFFRKRLRERGPRRPVRCVQRHVASGRRQGRIHSLSMQESGIIIPGDAKSLVRLRTRTEDLGGCRPEPGADAGFPEPERSSVSAVAAHGPLGPDPLV